MIVIHPLDLMLHFLKLLIEQREMARRGGRARRRWEAVQVVRQSRDCTRVFWTFSTRVSMGNQKRHGRCSGWG
jgi:hypothetical protein